MSDYRRIFGSPFFDRDPFAGRRDRAPARRVAVEEVPRQRRPLTRLEATEAELQATRAELDATRNALSATQSDLETSRTALRDAQADLAAHRAALESTRDELERARQDRDAAEQLLSERAPAAEQPPSDRTSAAASDEVERTRERLERESARELERARRDLVVPFLDVVDDLDRAIAAAHAGGESGAVIDGIELVRQSFLNRLGDLDVSRDEARGARFDPAVHEAISSVPAATPEDKGRIVAVLREGYRLGDQLLRPARVAVAV